MEFGLEEKPIKVGPWGGPGGSKWSTNLVGAVGVDRITTRHADAVDSIVFRTVYNNGRSEWSSKVGGEGGDRTDKVNFDWPAEIVTSIEGNYSSFYNGGPVVVRSLKFITNMSTYGPFGLEKGTHFNLPVTDGKIVGLYGRADRYLDAIGVCLTPLRPDTSVPCQPISGPKEQILKKSNVIDDIVRVHGPLRWPSLWGGVGGRPWDDGIFSGIKSIFIRRDNDAIYSICIEYDRSGKSVFSPHHGGIGGEIQNTIKLLDYPDEYLVNVCGFYGTTKNSDGFEIIKSLTFYTNKEKYGPLGREIGKFFTSVSDGKIVGLLGRSGAYLDAIGLHTEYS